MRFSILTDVLRLQLCEFIAERIGLHFPAERWPDLERGLHGVAEDFGFQGIGPCADWLLAPPLTEAKLQALARHLTVGETYFFREKKTFEALAERVLPELIDSRRNREKRLRLWSAACCTGEEPYSLAILLHQLIPDLKDWQITILATDINGRFLQKAAAGVYGEWSFRDTPDWLKECYFHRAADGRYAIRPEIKNLVTFAPLNLVEHAFPSLATGTNAMDVIFCRNVLMYFTPQQAWSVVRNLQNVLAEGGWLVVSPSEGAQAAFGQLRPVNFPGAILYRKEGKDDSPERMKQPGMLAPLGETAEITPSPREAILPRMPPPSTAASPETLPALPKIDPATNEPRPTPQAAAVALYQQGRYAEAADTLTVALAEHTLPDPQMFSLLARALANQGRLSDALTWCDRWVAAHKLDTSGHYLRAVVLQELGDHDQARRSLQRVTYLQPGFVLAHFALGNLARNLGKIGEADKHFTNTLNLLRGCLPHELLPESDGLTAGQLQEITSSILEREAAP